MIIVSFLPGFIYHLMFWDVLYLFTYTYVNVQSLKNELSNVFLLGMDQLKKVIMFTTTVKEILYLYGCDI